MQIERLRETMEKRAKSRGEGRCVIFQSIRIDFAPEASKETLTAAKKKYGFVPNPLGELAAAPTALKVYVNKRRLANSNGETSWSKQKKALTLG